jgi:hypothetical protein
VQVAGIDRPAGDFIDAIDSSQAATDGRHDDAVSATPCDRNVDFLQSLRLKIVVFIMIARRKDFVCE